ncbi:B2 bradykinin receptor [Oreochromis niloticus]|uniref:B2 bradykinin receptor n=1 Tax=Oreochromis niloticus TaxID=8128 RepID=UPI00022B1A1D|nr:B2 bradykinin receptor [Oreochromis niloticus]
MSGSQNNTNCTNLEPNSLIFTLGSSYILAISVLGIIFNAFVLMVFCFHEKACTIAEIYLSNLAGADFVLVCCLPFWADYVGKGFNWAFSESLCKVIPAIIKMNAFCSIYFLVLVSIDRYVGLVHPLSHHSTCTPFYAKLACVVVWILGVIFALPILIYRKLITSTSNITACGIPFTEDQHLVYETITITFSFVIPVSIISLCALKIIQALRNRPKVHGTEQKATTLILVVLLAFLICWGPFQLSRTLDVLERVGIVRCHTILDIYKQITVYLAFFNSVLNPILYVAIGRNFQKRAKELLMPQKYKKTRRSSTRSSPTRLASVKSDNGLS